MGKDYFILQADVENIQSGPFNWVGIFNRQEERIKVVIRQKGLMIDPKEEDFELDKRIPITKAEIIFHIEKTLNDKFR
jgi:hypothetical protein